MLAHWIGDVRQEAKPVAQLVAVLMGDCLGLAMIAPLLRGAVRVAIGAMYFVITFMLLSYIGLGAEGYYGNFL